MTPAEVRLAWKSRREIALIDLREEAAFARGHPLFAASLPLSRLELSLHDLLPRRDVAIVLYDDGSGLAATARRRLAGWGYSQVGELEGGLAAWTAAGLELFADVNSPSKAFGELVEQQRKTPHLTALELRGLLDANAELVVLDARRPDEHSTMNIPGSVSVPGAELVLRAKALAPDASTTIVVNCAGRTRSIIGAQSLLNAGVPNPVRALRNGTIGWTLDGLALEHGQSRRHPQTATPEHAREAAERARCVAYRAGVRWIGAEDVERLARLRTTYRFDVRSHEEFEAAHPSGFRHAPGGQLVQETDAYAPVRGAAIVVFDALEARAAMTASWLAQMGWDAFVLEPDADLPAESGAAAASEPTASEAVEIAAERLEAALQDGALLLDVAGSKAFRQGHIPGAHFVMRSRLALDLTGVDRARAIVLTSPDGRLARFAAPEVEAAIGSRAQVLAGGTAAWRRLGGALEAGPSPALSPPDDVYRRPYEGVESGREEMQAYLDWEYGLTAQLERDGSHGFFVI